MEVKPPPQPSDQDLLYRVRLAGLQASGRPSDSLLGGQVSFISAGWGWGRSHLGRCCWASFTEGGWRAGWWWGGSFGLGTGVPGKEARQLEDGVPAARVRQGQGLRRRLLPGSLFGHRQKLWSLCRQGSGRRAVGATAGARRQRGL